MRLGQLSRKISVRSNEIVAFLSKQGIAVEDSTNSRIDDPHVRLVISHFAPAMLSENLPSTTQEAVQEEANLPSNEDQGAAAERVEAPAIPESPGRTEGAGTEAVAEQDTSINELVNEINGVIKAPKVELQGLKVLGKIDLPEPKKKETEQPAPEATEPSEQRTGRGKRAQSKPHRSAQERRRRNPIAAERERQAREQEEQRKRQAELEKERKTQHYHKRVKPKAPTKALRIHDEEVVTAEETQSQPKTLWGRFVKWLTSY